MRNRQTYKNATLTMNIEKIEKKDKDTRKNLF